MSLDLGEDQYVQIDSKSFLSTSVLFKVNSYTKFDENGRQ